MAKRYYEYVPGEGWADEELPGALRIMSAAWPRESTSGKALRHAAELLERKAPTSVCERGDDE